MHADDRDRDISTLNAGKPVGAVVSALAILRYLASQDGAVSSIQTARALGLNPSTCFNILKTLVAERVVQFEEAGKAYRLGAGLVELAGSALDQVGYTRLIHPELERLAQAWQTPMTAWLRVSDARVMLVDRAETTSTIQIHMRIGHRLPLLVGALGRCMAAHAGFSPDTMKRQYAAIRQDNPPPFEQFLAEVEEARVAGYAVDRDGFTRGVTTVSSPILDAGGTPFLALSAVGLTAQFSDERVAAMAADLRDTTRRIGRQLAGTFRASSPPHHQRENAR
ncbi:IclR family transcriptional regulator [Azospirillum doebereinerae]|uniref:IclR family transcriptional regulator n=1 Tax=Azospirillum doebereinerae TaxID=92933 RepID=A0A3S0V1R5_9PROT|nr:IclR family transcriptional regulator [Azospirillum doebereinerae]RUQ72112.1 IclR family transcriptional regulator [Azospirillum doebereinerae]